MLFRSTNPGSGYRTTPVLEIATGNGSGAVLYPVMANGLVRSFKTVIKYDRYQYNTSITDWTHAAAYQVGDRVRFDDRVWVALLANGPAVQFPLTDPPTWQLVPAGSLSGVDRTMGYYVPSVNEPGLNLPILIDGIDYPGVQVYGRNFTSDETLDAIYKGSFTDILGEIGRAHV